MVSQSPAARVPPRNPALDGLRACCVALVLASGYHWMLPFGWSGVQVFFVLSGFLITEILLRETDQADSAVGFFKRFYARRALRIFPLYLLYLFALELASVIPGAIPDWSAARPYALTHTLNFGMVAGRFRVEDAFAHLWTLSVEEQFYLVWPLLVWCLPRATRVRLLWALVLGGPLMRAALRFQFGLDPGQIYLSTLSHLDAFATGGLLATYGVNRFPAARSWALASLIATVGAGLLVRSTTQGLAFRTLGLTEGLEHGGAYVWGYSLINMSAAFVIAAAARGGFSALAHPALAYVGRISYGVYVFQRPVKALYLAWVEPQLAHWLPAITLQRAVGYALCLGASVAVAAISFHGYERPLLRWRDASARIGNRPLA